MILNRMLGVPSVGTGRQRWIDNHGELNANNCVRDPQVIRNASH